MKYIIPIQTTDRFYGELTNTKISLMLWLLIVAERIGIK